ncbi:MAG: uridine kinase [Myxococcota bacterium]
MSKFVTGDGRTHISSTLMRESLQNREVIALTDSEKELRILPGVTLVSVGGQSIFDRGRAGLLPVVEQIAEATKTHKMVIGVGGGTRVRHSMSIAADLGLPLGGIAQLVGAMEECNAVFLNALLAKHGSIVMARDHFWELPLYLESGMTPIVISIPPYHFWEPPTDGCPVPVHGSDFGLFMHAEVLGMHRIIFVKDQDGLFDRDPERHDDAKLIEHTTLGELLENMPEELIIDRALFEAWRTARHIDRIHIINGLSPGALERALDNENVGTVIDREAV